MNDSNFSSLSFLACAACSALVASWLSRRSGRTSTLHCLLWLVLAWGLWPASSLADVTWAVVRLPNHGGSGTVIETKAGKTWILSCAHAFEGQAKDRRIKVDLILDSPGPPKDVGIRLYRVDYELDLSLIEMDHGPVDYICPIAPAGHRPGRNVWSVGYDEMRIPARRDRATLIAFSDLFTYARERPWHGRSGGPLIDYDAKALIGVCYGYEVNGFQRGIYVSHDAVVRFMKK